MYYRISNSSGTEEVGNEYPQIQEMGGSMLESDFRSIYDFPIRTLPDYNPNLDYLILHAKSKLSDFISAAHISNGFIISKKVKEILQSCNLPEHRFYPTTILFQGEKHTYWWFKYIGDIEDKIDYSKTQFLIIDSFSNKEELPILSQEELINKWKMNIGKMKDFRSVKIYFKKDFKNQLDLFELGRFDGRTCISKKLADKFTSNTVTGIDIVPASNLS
jgi:hypothetical protein